MIASRLCLALLLLLVPASMTSAPPGQQAVRAGAAEVLIAELDPGAPVNDKETVVSADGRKVAWRTSTSQKWSVVLNGSRQGGPFDEVRSLTFSRDGEHLVFLARRARTWVRVLDGTEAAAGYDEVRAPVFGLQGERLAYAARRGQRWTIVADGKESSSTYADVGWPMFSMDDQHLAYRAKPEKRWVVVVDGEVRTAEFDQIVAHKFSPDGLRLAYVGRRGDKVVAVLDGKEGSPFDIVGGMEFSSDSRRFAYGGAEVRKGLGKQKAFGRVIVDGEVGPEFEGEQVGSLLKNTLTASVPYLTEGYLARLSPQLHGVTAPVFSPDATRVATRPAAIKSPPP